MRKGAGGKAASSAHDRGRKRARRSPSKDSRGKPRRKQSAGRKPVYDRDRRELVVGKVVVKQLTQRSDAQETILVAFQEEGWPRSIDDPLTGKDGQDRKQRLRTAIANLNRRQRVPLLHFQVIRQGTGVAWAHRETTGKRTKQQRQ